MELIQGQFCFYFEDLDECWGARPNSNKLDGFNGFPTIVMDEDDTDDNNNENDDDDDNEDDDDKKPKATTNKNKKKKDDDYSSDSSIDFDDKNKKYKFKKTPKQKEEEEKKRKRRGSLKSLPAGIDALRDDLEVPKGEEEDAVSGKTIASLNNEQGKDGDVDITDMGKFAVAADSATG